MSSGRHLIALVRSHLDQDDTQFLTVTMQLAAHEARQGHANIAAELRDLVQRAKEQTSAIVRKGPVPLAQPKGELSTLVSASYPSVRLASMVLPVGLRDRLNRVLEEQKRQDQLLAHGLKPRRKLLLLGPPGSGKTMTASALAGELRLPLLSLRLEGVITRFMGETAAKLRVVFDAMVDTRGVYLFDEFDAIGARRTAHNDVGEIRRVLNSFLQFVENDVSHSIVIAATNHPELLDPALFRRFDDVIAYALPDASVIEGLFRARLATFDTTQLSWAQAVNCASGLSHADVWRSAEEAAKSAVLRGRTRICTQELLAAIRERQASTG